MRAQELAHRRQRILDLLADIESLVVVLRRQLTMETDRFDAALARLRNARESA